MSGQATGWVLRHGPRDRGMRLVLVAIADRVRGGGASAAPGLDAVAEASGYSRRQAVRLIGRLVDDGWLAVDNTGGGRGHRTTYTIVGLAGKGDTRGHGSEPLRGDIPSAKGCHPEPERVTSEPLKGDIAVEKTQQTRRKLASYGSDNGTDNGSSSSPYRQVDNAPDLPPPRTTIPLGGHRFVADQIAREVFGSPQPPIDAPFARVVDLLAKALAANRTPEQLRAAVVGREVTWTGPGLSTALGKAAAPKAGTTTWTERARARRASA